MEKKQRKEEIKRERVNCIVKMLHGLILNEPQKLGMMNCTEQLYALNLTGNHLKSICERVKNVVLETEYF